jgi:gliding motility-associated-like protein
MKIFFLVLSVTVLSYSLVAQVCTQPGQNPATAFPVCGTNVFTQQTVPNCGGRRLPSPNCGSDPLSDINPFWYKFTCFQTGTLGFLITPKDLSSDYDWELYDITGKDPNDVYSNGNMVVASNWSGESGLTGASSAGSQRFVCAGYGKPLFSTMPTIQAGHNYLLLVSHFSNTQIGYDLTFKGGTAVITDPDAPRLGIVEPNCSGDLITIQLSKKIKCSSIASDGSDFFITSSTSAPISSVGFDCSAKFDTDSIRIQVNRRLQPGNYKLQIKQGSDGNTLLDYCDQPVSTSDVIDFTIQPVIPTPMDSLVPVFCSPNTLKLIFSEPILCTSIAANGSDFLVNGPYGVGIANATGNCSGTGTHSKEILITLTQPLQRAGKFSVVLQRGTDGNTIVNDCGTETPEGAQIAFNIRDTVNADFTYNIQYSCSEDIINYSHSGQNGVTNWNWNLDDNIVSTQQSPEARYRVFNRKDIQLIVSNGFCSDTSKQEIILDNFLEVGFAVVEDNCHSEPVFFKSNSTGKIIEQRWSFGDGLSGSGDSTSHIYSPPAGTTTYKVQHTVVDAYGCQKTVEKPVTIYVNCHIDVPNAFTPNGDNKNDMLYPLNAIKGEQLEFRVYNRWGQLIFRTNNWKIGWDGRLNGQLQPAGSYVWTLEYVHSDTKQRVQKKGTTFLVR